MVERDTIKISTDAPWKDTPRLLKEDKKEDKIDVVIRSTPKDICIIEFTDKLPEEFQTLRI